MRITDIEVKNFRAFYGDYHINLGKAGKNLVIFGENGSGKSSLFQAFKIFFQASVEKVAIGGQENIFLDPQNEGSVEIRVRTKDSSNSSSTIEYILNSTEDKLSGDDAVHIADANKIRAFYDYKSLLKTHQLDTSSGHVNLFDLLVKDILHRGINKFTNDVIGEEWSGLYKYSYNYKQSLNRVNWIKDKLGKFNDGLTILLEEISSDTNKFLSVFGVNIKVSFIYRGVQYHGRRALLNQEILLDIEFCDKTISKHHNFLNEARLSALAISIYLASIRLNPTNGKLKLLVLDDLLIGLDMSNRIPLLGILEKYFVDDFQIILTTYDKVWFEVMRNYFGEGDWKYLELYSKKLTENSFDIPIIYDSDGFIDRAKHYLGENDYKASAVYLRTEFERLVKSICENKSLTVRYKKNQREIKSNDYWISIVEQTDLDESHIKAIETHRGVVMNPFSHYDLEKPEFKVELEQTIVAVEALQHNCTTIKKTGSVSIRNREIDSLMTKLSSKDEVISSLREVIAQKT